MVDPMPIAGSLAAVPEPGSPQELEIFSDLQARLPEHFRTAFADPKAPHTVLINPSLSLDQEVMAKIPAVHNYEERMLCLLLLLRLPRTRVIYVTSTPIAESIVDYYLHLLPGVPTRQARERLTLLSCHDASPRSLSDKILERPRLVERLRQAIGDPTQAHMTCFNVNVMERTLAVRLGIPIYGCDPSFAHYGSKSGSRRLFRESGLLVPPGSEDLGDEKDMAEALTALKTEHPELKRAVVKLNEGFSGGGNAVMDFSGAPERGGLHRWIEDRLPHLAFEAPDGTWEEFRTKFREMRGIVEAFVDGEDKRSPSSQHRIDPLGRLEIVSTHDQVLGGPSGHIFLGCRFPADQAYRQEIQAEGQKAGEALRDAGVWGRFGVDFISVRQAGVWRHYAIEVNLRKGGTTHPYLMLQFLTDGHYEPELGIYRSATGQPRTYYASDNLESPRYCGLTPDDLIDITVLHNLHFDAARQEGVVFHLIGALSEFGKIGLMCVGETLERSEKLFDDTVAVLDRECGRGT
ncbi:MAG: peptide ligase PGM1-related protein [Alphaproteobacteria bacterium]|nr:peptide ligase PGM1-related protein [Alphaproteobacteria bacterium]